MRTWSAGGSIGSTRLADAPYASAWEKFLDEWGSEMHHLQNHRAAPAGGSRVKTGSSDGKHLQSA